MSEMLEKKTIIILNFLQKIMVTNAFGELVLSKNMMQKKYYLWRISSSFIRTKLEETGSQLGNFNKMSEMLEKLIIILIFSQKVMVANALSWLLLFRNMI